MNLILEHFVNSTNGAVTKEFENSSLPVGLRGILKKKIIKNCLKTGRDFYYIDTGYFGNYPSEANPLGWKVWHRIIKNGLQNHADLKILPRDRLDRLEKDDTKLKWTGWKTNRKNILLVVPSEKPCKYYGIDKDAWLNETINKIKMHTDRPIIVREKVERAERTRVNTIYEALDNDIYAVVTYNSIAAIESIAYGIPAFVLAPSAADSVASKDLSQIETPFYPDADLIDLWKRNLAYSQFTETEIVNGTAWKILTEK